MTIKKEDTEITVQNTSVSKLSPFSHPGQAPHEVVFGLRLRDDGKVYLGTATFTASKPVEAEVAHTYAPTKKQDSRYGEPYHIQISENKAVAITHLRKIVDEVPMETKGTEISSGSFNFIGNALAFHKTSGEPFTVNNSFI